MFRLRILIDRELVTPKDGQLMSYEGESVVTTIEGARHSLDVALATMGVPPRAAKDS